MPLFWIIKRKLFIIRSRQQRKVINTPKQIALGYFTKGREMDKLSKLLETARLRLPSLEILNIQNKLKNLNNDELLEALNQAKTKNESRAVIYELVDRSAGGEWFNSGSN